MKETSVALVQMRMGESADKNLARAEKKISEAAKKGAQIVCLPELFTSPYFPREPKKDFSRYAETIPGKITEKLSTISKKHGIILVAGSLYECAGNKFYNTTPLFGSDGKLLGTYRKTHIPHDEHFYEKDYFQEGDQGIKVFPTSQGTIAPLICFDQWYPEAARSAALLGTDIIFYPTAIGTSDDLAEDEGNWRESWKTVMRGHAIANSVWVAAVNRVGKEGEMNFWGGSFVCDPFGKIVAEAGSEEEILMIECDLSLGKKINEAWGFFRNRRPDIYTNLCAPRKN